MTIKKCLPILAGMLCLFVVSNAQIEAAHLSSKEFAGFGFGAFLNLAVPVSQASYVTGEVGLYDAWSSDGYNAGMFTFLAGFRYMLNGGNTGYYEEDNSGFYIEPLAGYAIGSTDIPKDDPNGNSTLYDSNGNEIYEKVTGATAGVSLGYIIPGNFPLNIGLRYVHTFVASDPSFNTIALRISHPLFRFGRRW